MSLLPWLAQPAYTAQDHLLRGGTAHSGLGPLTPVISTAARRLVRDEDSLCQLTDSPGLTT